MTPFYFGSGDRRLFGIYQPSAQGSSGKRAAILCYPRGEEYIYAHRAMRRLATALCDAGFHTLRFDFFGTGDSAGEIADCDPLGCETDLEMALQEMTDIVGTQRVTLIGLRSGATVAKRVASKQPNTIDALVLWDPVLHCDDPKPSSDVSLRQKIRWRRPSIHETAPQTGCLPPGPISSALPQRTLVLVTERLATHATPPVPTPETFEFPNSEFIDDIQPWLEESASVGRVPMKVIQRMLMWLQ